MFPILPHATYVVLKKGSEKLGLYFTPDAPFALFHSDAIERMKKVERKSYSSDADIEAFYEKKYFEGPSDFKVPPLLCAGLIFVDLDSKEVSGFTSVDFNLDFFMFSRWSYDKENEVELLNAFSSGMLSEVKSGDQDKSVSLDYREFCHLSTADFGSFISKKLGSSFYFFDLIPKDWEKDKLYIQSIDSIQNLEMFFNSLGEDHKSELQEWVKKGIPHLAAMDGSTKNVFESLNKFFTQNKINESLAAKPIAVKLKGRF